MLLYSQTSVRFDPLEIQRLAFTQEAHCTIVRNSLRDGNTFNYFAFVDFAGKRFQTRNLRLFDIQGYHPKWVHLTSSPWRNLDQMLKSGEVVWNGVSRPQGSDSPKEKLSSSKKISSSSTDWELLGSSSNEKSFLELCKSRMGQEVFESFTKILEQPMQSGHGETDMSLNVRYWQDGYRAGREAAFSISKNQMKDAISISE
jgi:hypothetical protein